MTQRRIGARMQAVRLYVAGHPGCTKMAAAQAAGTSRGNIRLGYDAVDRAISAGLVTARRTGTKYALFPAGYTDCVRPPSQTGEQQ